MCIITHQLELITNIISKHSKIYLTTVTFRYLMKSVKDAEGRYVIVMGLGDWRVDKDYRRQTSLDYFIRVMD